MKHQHPRAFQAKKAWKASPVLVFQVMRGRSQVNRATRLGYLPDTNCSSRNCCTAVNNCMRFFSMMTVCVPSPICT